MNDLARMVSTIVVWSVVGVVMIALAVFGEGSSSTHIFLIIGAIASMGIIWRPASKQAETDAKAKRSERLAQRLAEERLDEEDIVSLEELLEEERASRRLQDP